MENVGLSAIWALCYTDHTTHLGGEAERGEVHAKFRGGTGVGMSAVCLLSLLC